MAKLIRNTIFISLSIYLCLASVVHAKRVALVIGNGAYQYSPLKNPVNDANDMARSLEALGFIVIKVTDANLRTMHMALNEFSRNLTRGDVALFFYAGHGLQFHGENYLLPIGNQVLSASDVRYEAFQVGRLLGRMEDAQSMNIIILDSCRSKPLGRGFTRSLDRGLAVIQQKPEGTFIAYATAPGKTAADGEGINGLFTTALLNHIATRGLNISKMLRKVRADVKKMSSGKQIPWSESSLTSEFYFARDSRDLSTSEVQESTNEKAKISVARDLSQENLFWETIKDSDDPVAFKAYIEQYPHGAFHSLALLKISALEKDTAESVVQVEKDVVQQKPEVISEGQVEKIAIGNDPVRIGEFLTLTNNILYDKKENLEWMVGEDKNTSRYNLKKYIKKLADNNGEWRIPSLAELKTLYNNGLTADYMKSVLGLTGWKVWSKTVDFSINGGQRKETTKLFDFKKGKVIDNITFFGYSDPIDDIRVLAVRSKKGQLEKDTAGLVVQAEKDVAQQKPEVTSEEQVDKIVIGDEPVRIGEFLTFSDNILYDKKENLEWMVGEDKNTSHYNSKKFIKKLADNKGEWRIPTLAELKTLYSNGLTADYMESVLGLTGWKVWSKTVDFSISGGSRKEIAKLFDFKKGKVIGNLIFTTWTLADPIDDIRVLAVRSK